MNLKQILSATACLSIFATSAFAADGPTLEIQNFIGTIDVKTGDYDKITVVDADGVKIAQGRANVSIDNDDRITNLNCRWRNNGIEIGKGGWGYKRGGRGYKSITEYPKIVIHAPRNTHLIIADALVFGTVGDIGSGDIHIKSCGGITLDDVAGDLDLKVSGSGDVNMGNAADVNLSISGSGDLVAGNFDRLDVKVSGSGDLVMGDVKGRATIYASGSSDLEIGHIGASLHLESSGSSDLKALSVRGTMSLSVSGSGDVKIAGGAVDELDIRASGASDVIYRGSSVNAKVRASGASDVYINQPSGNLRSSDSGAADINIKSNP